eukprot:5574883-Prymnesium_polylepis.1
MPRVERQSDAAPRGGAAAEAAAGSLQQGARRNLGDDGAEGGRGRRADEYGDCRRAAAAAAGLVGYQGRPLAQERAGEARCVAES